MAASREWLELKAALYHILALMSGRAEKQSHMVWNLNCVLFLKGVHTSCWSWPSIRGDILFLSLVKEGEKEWEK